MSLILDALNRSRQDAQEFPDIASQHYVEPPATSGSGVRWLLGVALAFALAVVAWLLWERHSAPVTTSRQQLESPATQTAAMPPVELPTRKSQMVAKTAAPQLEIAAPKRAERAPVPAPVSHQVSVSAPTPVPTPRPTPAPAVASVDPGVAALYRQASTAPGDKSRAGSGAELQRPASVAKPSTARVEEQPIDIEKLVLQAREEIKSADLMEHDAPMISSLSQQTKDRIPSIFYQQHDYSGTESNSSVTLNGKALRAGGTISGGLRVVEILPDSVVLEFQGTRFRLSALNSWVNL